MSKTSLDNPVCLLLFLSFFFNRKRYLFHHIFPPFIIFITTEYFYIVFHLNHTLPYIQVCLFYSAYLTFYCPILAYCFFFFFFSSSSSTLSYLHPLISFFGFYYNKHIVKINDLISSIFVLIWIIFWVQSFIYNLV